VVWKLHFVRDVGAGLSREMDGIESALRLPAGGRLDVGERFAALQRNLLLRQCERFEFSGRSPDPAGGYFGAQAEFAAFLRAGLEARYGTVEGESLRVLHVLRRAIRMRAKEDHEATREDWIRINELTRLVAFDPALYDRPTLTQEQIAENLKRTRGMVMRKGFANALHNLVPVAVGPRVAHIRVPGPLAVDGVDPALDDDAARAKLLADLHDRMQASLHLLRCEVAPVVERHARPNPLHSGAGPAPAA
jgi:hypothetical protein